MVVGWRGEGFLATRIVGTIEAHGADCPIAFEQAESLELAWLAYFSHIEESEAARTKTLFHAISLLVFNAGPARTDGAKDPIR